MRAVPEVSESQPEGQCKGRDSRAAQGKAGTEGVTPLASEAALILSQDWWEEEGILGEKVLAKYTVWHL